MTNTEINAAVARKLGWKEGRHSDPLDFTWTAPNGMRGYVPDYSGSIAAAWELVEHLRELEFWVAVKAWPMENRKAYSCSIEELGTHAMFFSEASTAPMAICLAYLKLEAK